MASRILIVYESKYGQTQKIAKFICDRMSLQGHTVELMNMNHLLPVDFTVYDGVIVGAPIYMRRYPKRLQKWTRDHAEHLNKKPSGFFSVCMAVLMKDERTQRDLLSISETFFRKTTWYPKRRKVFAGAVCFTKYGFFVHMIMMYFAKQAGHKLNTDKDYEFTNWIDVARFSDEFVNSLQPRREFGVEGSPG